MRGLPVKFEVEKGRILVPVGKPCPYGCRYCYTRGGEVGPARTRAGTILEQFEEFAKTHVFNTIQFGYDSDPFAFPERGVMMLERLAQLGRHLNFSTKSCIEGTVLDALAKIRSNLASEITFTALVSLSCWHSAEKVEPRTPTPEQRMQTVSNLMRIGIPAFIAVQPFLPHIEMAEYEHLIGEALCAGCAGFVLGPLYADKEERFVSFLPKGALSKIPGEETIISWSAHHPVWTRYEDPRLRQVAIFAQSCGGPVYWSSADAIDSYIAA
ncbi:hypothetical protein KSF_106220 [Reticulibacter mediterranei]|uniref:Radical SAM core domain-containing protein n=1 Tax=Reticulibacter mediterranei TaxID=2778369 RepID=A0A8J3IRC2_9CHLR|nr:radical SAM protein [Reticulibacter mediterranei]GHP00575.1 hypothetical protein KSF_106220 [Reticulibacter mediterranei]